MAATQSTLPAYRPAGWRPLVDIYRTDGGWSFKFELPGVRPNDLTVEVAANCLHIAGHREDCLALAGYRHRTTEIRYNRFERSIELPESVEGAVLISRFDRGMLLVELRKS